MHPLILRITVILAVLIVTKHKFQKIFQVGICGRTGSGKSSLFRLLFKILDVTAGEIIIDGVNLSNVSISQAR